MSETPGNAKAAEAGKLAAAAEEAAKKKGKGGRPPGSKNKPKPGDKEVKDDAKETGGACEKCGQGEGNPTCSACAREVSTMTPNQAEALAGMWTGAILTIATAVGGDGYVLKKEAVDNLFNNAHATIWAYRNYLSKHLILVSFVGAHIAVVGPAVAHRRAKTKAARDAEAQKKREDAAGIGETKAAAGQNTVGGN